MDLEKVAVDAIAFNLKSVIGVKLRRCYSNIWPSSLSYFFIYFNGELKISFVYHVPSLIRNLHLTPKLNYETNLKASI